MILDEMQVYDAWSRRDLMIVYMYLDEICVLLCIILVEICVGLVEILIIRLCGSGNFAAPWGLTNCASYDTLALLTRPRDLYETFMRP